MVRTHRGPTELSQRLSVGVSVVPVPVTVPGQDRAGTQEANRCLVRRNDRERIQGLGWVLEGVCLAAWLHGCAAGGGVMPSDRQTVRHVLDCVTGVLLGRLGSGLVVFGGR